MTTYAQDRDGKRIILQWTKFYFEFNKCFHSIIIGKYIPASQRPDGTWRKARRVKDGYIPQEEVPLYESKGKLFMKKPAIPVGMCPILAQEAKEKRQKQQQANPKPGMYVLPSTSNGIDVSQKRKQNAKPSPNGLSKNTANKSVKYPKTLSTISVASTSTDKYTNKLCDAVTNLAISTDDDLAKTIKKLRKKIREIEAIESKISNGELKKPDPDQLEKVGRKNEILDRLRELERLENK